MIKQGYIAKLILLVAVLLMVAMKSNAEKYVWSNYDISFEAPQGGQILNRTKDYIEIRWNNLSMSIRLHNKEGIDDNYLKYNLRQLAKEHNMFGTNLQALKNKQFKGYYLTGAMTDGTEGLACNLVSKKSNLAVHVQMNYSAGRRNDMIEVLRSFEEGKTKPILKTEKYTWSAYNLTFDAPKDGTVMVSTNDYIEIAWLDFVLVINLHDKEGVDDNYVKYELQKTAREYNMYDTEIRKTTNKQFKGYYLTGTMPDGTEGLVSNLVSKKNNLVVQVKMNYPVGVKHDALAVLESFIEGKKQKIKVQPKPKEEKTEKEKQKPAKKATLNRQVQK